MTLQSEILDDPNYIPCLDHGFLGLVEYMGSDEAIVRAARVSYGKGTKSVRENRGLIRYLLRHAHTSPIEMAEVKLHIKLPIFVMRQWIRHRVANVNEYSARYSEMSNEFYIPECDVIQPQSTDNKQGRSGNITPESKEGIRWLFKTIYETVYDGYQTLLGYREPEKFISGEPLYDAYGEDDPLLDQNYPGLARELSRSVLSVGNYTECFWKCDLSNIIKLLKLRMDSHAQYEIRVFADAIFTLLKPIFPMTMEAAEDYIFQAYTLSRMEISMLKKFIQSHKREWQAQIDLKEDGLKEFVESNEMTLREYNEFKERFGI